MRFRQSKRFLLATVAGTAIVVSFLTSHQAFAGIKDKQIKVWKFEQRSHIEGPITLLVGSSSVKMICPIQHLICVAHGPKWDVTIVNEKEHLGIVFPCDQWRTRGFRLFDKGGKSRENGRTPTSWHGHPAEKIVRVVDTSDPVKEQLEMLYRESGGRSVEFKSEEFLYDRWLPIAPGLHDFLSGIYGMQSFNGVMLSRTRKYNNGRIDTAFETFSCGQTMVDSSVFDYPTGFKTASSINEITQLKKKRQQAAGMLEEMFLEPDGSSGKVKAAPK